MKVLNKSNIIIALLITVGICCLCLNAYADSISSRHYSITMQNQALSDVFQRLSNESGFQILYNDALGTQRINLNLKSVTLESALQKILARQNHTIVYDRKGTIQINVYGAGTPERVRSAKPVNRKQPRLKTHATRRSSKHPGLKLSKKLLEKSASQPEVEEVDATALIKPNPSTKELPPQAKALFNIMSGESNSNPPTTNSK